MRVLVIDRIHSAGIELLQQHAQVTHLLVPPSSADLADFIGEYTALMMRVTPKIDGAVLARSGRLKVISVASVGTDHIDLTHAADRGIRVFNQPGVNRDSVAEFTFGLLLCLVRMIPTAANSLRNGHWGRHEFQHGIELAGRTLGIIGFGNTGSRVAEIAQGFRMRVLSFSPYTHDWRVKDKGVNLVSLDELLSESDIVTVQCPLTPQTVDLIGEKQLQKMRSGSYLLNLARGGIVNEDALYNALRSGHLAGAASDVFKVEPPEETGLLTLSNFIGTPHIAGQTVDSLWRAGTGAAEQVLHSLGIQITETPSCMITGA